MNVRASVANLQPSALPCRVEAVATEQRLAELAAEWRAASERSDSALLFNSHEWASACWRHFHAGEPGARLWVLVVRDSHRVRAVLPFWMQTRRFVGAVIRTAHLLGEGPSDYGDLLCAAADDGAIGALADYLLDHRDDWDVLDCRETPPDSALAAKLLPRLLAAGCRVETLADNPCRSIPAGGGWAAYYSRHFNSKRRRDHRRDRRILETTGTLTEEWLNGDVAVPALAEEFAQVQAAHAQAGEHRPGEFNDPRFRPFLEHMMTAAAQQGGLRVSVMRRDAAVVAYYIAFHYRDRYCVYNTAHRADAQQYSVGKLLMLFTLEKLFDERGGMIDFMRGDEPYKETWTEACAGNLRLRITGPSRRARLGWALSVRLMPALERRAPRLDRVLAVATEEGWRGLVERARRRFGNGRRA